jgi:hypothetical protein
MKKSVKQRLYAYLFAFIFLFLFFGIFVITKEREENKLLSEYPYLTKADSLNNSVESTFYPSDWRGGYMFQMVTLDNGKKYTISAISPGDESLQDILNKGIVTIKKKVNNDTITIITGGKDYIFVRFDNE